MARERIARQRYARVIRIRRRALSPALKHRSQQPQNPISVSVPARVQPLRRNTAYIPPSTAAQTSPRPLCLSRAARARFRDNPVDRRRRPERTTHTHHAPLIPRAPETPKRPRTSSGGAPYVRAMRIAPTLLGDSDGAPRCREAPCERRGAGSCVWAALGRSGRPRDGLQGHGVTCGLRPAARGAMPCRGLSRR